MAHVSAPIPPASSHNPELPPEVDDVLARGLAKEPEHRFGSCADFVHALRDALDRAAGTTSIAALPPVAPVRHARRNRLPAVLAAVGALVLAGVVAAALLAGDDDPETVKETVTLGGTTIVETVTTEAAPTTAEPASRNRSPSPSRRPRRRS